ncbi:MAG: nucleotidyltransferase domain-containing protein [Spirochaetales bacterium]|nr:nucleotidyltransferase domain-containing protein [Spirochaetales bacterium]
MGTTDKAILIRYERDPLQGYTKENFTDLLKEKLTGRVSQAWLFGSFVTDRFTRDSDIDLLLVCDTDLPFPERGRIFDDIYDLGPEMDILVYRTEELRKIRENPSIGFWTSVTSSMVRLL